VKRLLQDLENSWKVLVVCILLNRTGGETVRSVLPSFFMLWPTAEDMISADVSEVVGCIKACGLQNRKAGYLIAMSKAYLSDEWSEVEDLPGIGKYASDSWKMFIEKRTDIVP